MSMRSLVPVLRSAHRQASRPLRNSLRTLATRATPAKPQSISAVLQSGTAAVPLKDAVKFVSPDAKSTVWTFRELTTHVNALASGLRHLQYPTGSRIVTVLPAHSPEYAVLLMAAARARLTLIAYPYSNDSAPVNTSDLAAVISEHEPVCLVLADGLSVHAAPPTDASALDDRVIAAVNPVLKALDPSLALRDAAGLAGCVPLTGRSLHSDVFPSLRHVVHTGVDNVRSAITFRSLLVYDDVGASKSPSVRGGEGSGIVPPLLVGGGCGAAGDRTAITEEDVLSQAVDIGDRLKLSANHGTRNGKIVVKGEASKQAASTAVAALLHHSLWLSSHPDSVDQVSADENAIVS